MVVILRGAPSSVNGTVEIDRDSAATQNAIKYVFTDVIFIYIDARCNTKCTISRCPITVFREFLVS